MRFLTIALLEINRPEAVELREYLIRESTEQETGISLKIVACRTA